MSGYIVVLGDINADITAFAKRLPKRGETVTGYEVQTYPGGKGANQADQCAKLGVKTYMIGKVGMDYQGDMVLSSLQEDAVDCTYVKRISEVQTGCAVINIDEDGNNAIIYTPAANDCVTIEDIEDAKELISNAGVFITQNAIDQKVTVHALKTAHEAGVITIFNPAPASELPDEIYQYVDYITPNETECEMLTGISQDSCSLEDWKQQSAAWFYEKGVKHVCITMGSEGVFYAAGKESMTVPAFSVKAIDATAAGDSFHGGFAYGLIKKYSIQSALQIGCACGGMTTMGKGAQVSIRKIEAVEEFLKEQGITLN